MNISAVNLSATLGSSASGIVIPAAAKQTTSSGLSVASPASGDSGSSSDASDASASGDTVVISAEGQSLAAAMTLSSNASTAISGSFSETTGTASMTGSASTANTTTAAEAAAAAEKKGEQTVQKQIEKLQEQIAEARQDPNLTDKERREKVQRLQSELMQLQAQQQKTLAKSGGGDALAYHGGTRAKGASSSLT
ncbi:MAG: hypothetical protein AUJ49_09760 [Desulfovibrionaceae bacterium CG1_02_65_16]|nr:MAG: hypothetical protein AUJ49_09760 [Desulfovibrionaceae bacterium CG1_02_65_16]